VGVELEHVVYILAMGYPLKVFQPVVGLNGVLVIDLIARGRFPEERSGYQTMRPSLLPPHRKVNLYAEVSTAYRPGHTNFLGP
jgi:hypothetical protein